MQPERAFVERLRLAGTLGAHRSYNWLERYALRSAHPRKFFSDLAVGTGSLYLVWAHEWVFAALLAVVGFAASTISVLSVDLYRLAGSRMGRMMLVSLNPVNFTLQLSGGALLIHGLWGRTGGETVFGVCLIFLGHAFGWSRADTRYHSNLSR